MMKLARVIIIFLVLGVFFIGLYYLFDSPGEKQAQISDIYFARSIDQETAQPVETTDSFSSSESVYLSFKIIDATKDTAVRIEWWATDQGKLIGQEETTTNGTRYLSFIAQAPNAVWPIGKYQAKIFVNGQETGLKDFVISNISTD